LITSISTTKASVLRGVHQINNHGNIDSIPILPMLVVVGKKREGS